MRKKIFLKGNELLRVNIEKPNIIKKTCLSCLKDVLFNVSKYVFIAFFVWIRKRKKKETSEVQPEIRFHMVFKYNIGWTYNAQ